MLEVYTAGFRRDGHTLGTPAGSDFFLLVLNSVGMIYALVVITMVCRKKVSVRIKSLITSAVT